jgi:hypothetical protein
MAEHSRGTQSPAKTKQSGVSSITSWTDRSKSPKCIIHIPIYPIVLAFISDGDSIHSNDSYLSANLNNRGSFFLPGDVRYGGSASDV